MNLKYSFSHLIATMLGMLALMLAPTKATAEESELGTLSFPKGTTVTVNGQKVSPGYHVKPGDVITTTGKATVMLDEGGSLEISPGSKVRVYMEGSTVIAAVLTGGVKYIPSHKPGRDEQPVIVDSNPGSGADPLPYLAAFSGVNFPVGGGSSGAVATAALVNLLIKNGVPASVALSVAGAVDTVLKAGGGITITGANGAKITFGTLGSAGNGATPVVVTAPNGTTSSTTLPAGSIL